MFRLKSGLGYCNNEGGKIKRVTDLREINNRLICIENQVLHDYYDDSERYMLNFDTHSTDNKRHLKI